MLQCTQTQPCFADGLRVIIFQFQVLVAPAPIEGIIKHFYGLFDWSENIFRSNKTLVETVQQ